MGRFRALCSRCRLEVAIVVVPLLAILVLQYVSSRRLAQVEVIAQQTAIAQFLDTVVTGVRRVYEDAAHEMLGVSSDALVAREFEKVVQHWVRLFFVDGPERSWGLREQHGKSYLTRRRRGEAGDGGGSVTGGATPSA